MVSVRGWGWEYLCGTKAARALLVKFGPWSHTIERDVKQFAEFDGGDHAINIMENDFKHCFFCLGLDIAQVVAVGTVMHNAVDVKVKVIENFIFAAHTIHHSFQVFVP